MARRKIVGIVTLVLLIGAVVIVANRGSGRVEVLQNTPAPAVITSPGLIDAAYGEEPAATTTMAPANAPEWEFANRLTAFAQRYDAYDRELQHVMTLFKISTTYLNDEVTAAEEALTRAEEELAAFKEFQSNAATTLRATLAGSTRELKDLTAKLHAIRTLGTKEEAPAATR